jgi:1-deoxy-D-xylulose-5-phosphate synthase
MEYQFLNRIKSPADVKKLDEKDLPILAEEIRDELIKTVSKNGGHLASNLGVVELSIALHRVFNSPKDKIVWDVGHQCYVHKLLTGRFDDFETIRLPGGLSGFTRRYESEHDIMSGGHSSVALSAAYGIAAANRIKGKKDYTIAVVGDGAFTGGMVYEALNNAGRAGKGTKLIVILNDNEMSISKNVGALARYFAVIKANPRYFRLKARTENALNKIPYVGRKMATAIFRLKTALKNKIYNSTMFEDLGFRYMGPIDGHDINHLCDALKGAVEADYPVILHINTTKGKGYEFAERAPDAFHGVSAFDLVSGEPIFSEPSFSDEFGSFIVNAAAKDNRICCITAAMALGTGLKQFSTDYPDRFFDVGIAEQHATTFAAGLARGGMLPVFAVYSTFLQRAYDQIIHDCAMQKLKIVFAVDRAGFVGSDGESHHGIFDTAFLNSIPDITVMAPSTFKELDNCFYRALYHTDGPVAVRYPRGIEPKLPDDFEYSGSDWDYYGNESAPFAIVTYGRLFSHACKAKQLLSGMGTDVAILKLNTIKPVSNGSVKSVLHCKNVFFFEEGQRFGGIGETFADKLFKFGYTGKYALIAVEGEFPVHNTINGLLAHYGLDCDGMVQKILKDTQNDSEEET